MGGLFRKICRARTGSVYLELAAAAFIMVLIFVGTGAIGAKTIDMDRGDRAVSSGIDLAWQLDTETTAPTQSDINRIGGAVTEIMSAGSTEAFEMHFTVVEYDHVSGMLRVSWSGSYGTDPARASRVSIASGRVYVNGVDFTVRDDERMVIFELYRARRGLLDAGPPDYYSNGVVMKYDPSHA